MSQLSVPVTVTKVTVSSTYNGEELSQDIPVQHPQGVEEALVIAQALMHFKQMGGFMIDTPTGMKFYMASKLDAPINFKVSTIQLAGVNDLPKTPASLRS